MPCRGKELSHYHNVCLKDVSPILWNDAHRKNEVLVNYGGHAWTDHDLIDYQEKMKNIVELRSVALTWDLATIQGVA